MPLQFMPYFIFLFLSLSAGLSAAERISALGRVEPKGGLIHLQGPRDRALKAILVETNQWIRAGETLAVFQGDPSKGVELRILNHKMKLLDKQQKAELEWREKEIELTQQSALRAEQSYQLLSAKELGIAQDILEDKKERWQALLAKGPLLELQTAEIRALHERERHDLQTQINKLEMENNAYKLIAPVSGQLLRFFYQPGEIIDGREPFAIMGDTKNIEVVAEVYESDALKRKNGMKASIHSKAFDEVI